MYQLNKRFINKTKSLSFFQSLWNYFKGFFVDIDFLENCMGFNCIVDKTLQF